MIHTVKRKTRGPHVKDELPLKKASTTHHFQVPPIISVTCCGFFLMIYFNEMQWEVFKFSEMYGKKYSENSFLLSENSTVLP